MDDLIIRTYQPADLDACCGLWAELVQRHRDIYGDPTIGGAEPGLHFDRHLARLGAARIWVAEDRGRVVGMAGLDVADGGHEADIEPVVVTAAGRGAGAGRALVRHVMEVARGLGLRYLNVRPVARNVEAISFFFEAGFQTLGQIELFMDLGDQSARTWQPGPDLFGHRFLY